MIIFTRILRAAMLICLSAVWPDANAEAAQAGETPPGFTNSAVILIYHRFGNSSLPSTNIRLDQIDAHIDELTASGARFMKLGQYVAARRRGEDTGGPVIIVTVDDAYESFFTEGWPRFKAAGIPVTLFVATGPVDDRAATLMSWDQIRALQADGVEIGNHGHRHLHMNAASDAEIFEDLTIAKQRLRAELGIEPLLFAYPYGEFSLRVRDLVKQAGFVPDGGSVDGCVGPSAIT